MRGRTGLARPPVIQKNLTVLFYLPVLLPVALLFSSILVYSSNLPFLDEWDTAALIVKLHNGGFTFNDFWAQHNEHRIVLPRLLFLALSLFGSWDIARQIFASFIVALLTLVAAWRLLKLTLPSPRLLPPATLLAALLLCSPVQYENWLWGFELSWFLVNFLAFVAILLLYRWPNRGRSLALAAFITVLATFTLASGIPLWPALFCGLVLQWKTWQKRYLAAWLAAWLVTMAVYFYNYRAVSYHPDSLYFLKHPLEFCAYVLVYLGNPLAFWSKSVEWPLALGLISLLTLAGMLGWLGWRYARQKGSPWPGLLPWIQLALFSVFNAAITAIGRVGFGLDQAQASRYTTLANLYWLAWLVTGLIFARQLLLERPPRFRRLLIPVMASVAVLLGGLYGFSYARGQAGLESWGTAHRDLVPFVLDYPAASDDTLLQVFPNVAYLKTWTWPLDQLKEGPFAPGVRAKYQDLDRRKQALISTDQNRALVLPAASLSLVSGDRPSVEYQGPAMRFQHYGAGATGIYVDLSKAPEYQGLSGAALSLDLQFEQAWYARIFWDTGNGLNDLEKRLLYPVAGAVGRPHFVAGLPPGTKAFRVDVYYKNGRVDWDSMQASLYRGKVD